jgi:hypothetical protein
VSHLSHQLPLAALDPLPSLIVSMKRRPQFQKGLEMYSIIFNTLRPPVKDLRDLLKGRSDGSQRTIHVPCSVLKHVLDFGSFVTIRNAITDLVNSLNSRVGKVILARKCSNLVMIRWIHLADGGHFILSHLSGANTILQICEQWLVSGDFVTTY